jgi:hypothetical protein
MKRVLVTAIGVTAMLASMQLVLLTSATGAEADVPTLPGITSPDPYPEGCVSCHKGELLLKTKLDALKHRNIDSKVAVIPNDCEKCHSEEGGMDPMANIAHSMHYASGSKSDFVAKYNGSCLNCHQVATGSGEVTVKSGKRNW